MSLLWSKDSSKKTMTLSKKDMDDMGIEWFVDFFQGEKKQSLDTLIHEIPIEIQDIKYRQSILKDCVNNPLLFDKLLSYGQDAFHQMTLSKFAFEKEATIYNLIKRVAEVDGIRKTLEDILHMFEQATIESQGLKQYHQLLQEIVDSRIYDAFIRDVEMIKSQAAGVKSIKIGLNLDEYLQPIEAILLDVSEEVFKYGRFDKKMEYYAVKGMKEVMLIPRKIFAKETIAPPEALNNLEKIVEPAMLQLISFCDQFTRKILEVLSILHEDLPYYSVGVTMYQQITDQGYIMTLPKWGQDYKAKDLYHLHLAMKLKPDELVFNTIELTKDKPINILTGANRGGKTTTTQSIMQSIWMGQLGFFVAAKEVELPLVSVLKVHFPREEKETVDYGRLGEECNRFKEMFEQSSSTSFFFMNESFSGTSHHESLQISVEILQAIYQRGSFVLFNTHLHELVETLEKKIPQKSIQSLIAGKDMDKSPYVIERGRPLGKSYGIEIAKKYGMNYETLIRIPH